MARRGRAWRGVAGHGQAWQWYDIVLKASSLVMVLIARCHETEQAPEEAQQQLQVIPTQRTRAVMQDEGATATRQAIGTEAAVHTVEPERTVESWDAFVKFDGASRHSTSGRSITVRFKTTYTERNATFEASFQISTRGCEDEEAFLEHVCRHINTAAQSAGEEHDRWLGPDRNLSGFLVKSLMPQVQ